MANFPIGVPIFLCSVEHKRQLSCTDKATIKTFPNKLDWEEWKLEKSGGVFFLSSYAHDQRLMCSDKGALSGCKNRLSWEKWRLIDAGGGHWFLESNEHRGKFLSSDKEGNVFTTGNKLAWEKWAIERSVWTNEPVFLCSVEHKRQLSCTDKATIKTFPNKLDWEEWKLEKSGGVFFLSSRAHDQRLMCSDKGALSGCKNRLSWEKWRLIDAGGGHWFLESNEHRGKFLSSDKEGNVFTTGNKLSWEKWAIERSVWTNEPVFLCSVEHKRQLSCTDKATIKTFPNKLAWEEWKLEKSGGVFFLSSYAHDQRLMCSDKGALSGCKNRLSWEKWRLIDAGGGHWFLESNEHRGKFLSSDKEGNVFTTGNKLAWEKWAIERKQGRGNGGAKGGQEGGKTVNSYQLGKELGQGAWGKTYLAVNPLTKQKFAIKEFKIEYKVQEKEFKKEIDNLMLIPQHRCLVEFKDAFLVDGRLYIVMELAQGRPWSKISPKSLPLLPIFRNLFSGVAHMHKHNFIHRDLHGGNLLVNTNSNPPAVKILDLGNGRFFKRSENLSFVAGDIRTWSPERQKREKYNEKDDIWAAGYLCISLALKEKWGSIRGEEWKNISKKKGIIREAIKAMEQLPGEHRSMIIKITKAIFLDGFEQHKRPSAATIRDWIPQFKS